MSQTTQRWWEKEFNDKYGNGYSDDWETNIDGHVSVNYLDVRAFIASIEDETVRRTEKEIMEREYRFIINILDGVDIADEQLGNKGGGTKAIRLALQSRNGASLTPEDRKTK